MDLLEEITIGDAGDIFVIPSNIEKTFDQIDLGVSHILDAGAFPVIIGGDHSIGYPDCKAIAKHVDGKLGIVHFDRHIDMAVTTMDERMHTTHWSHATKLANVPSASTEPSRSRWRSPGRTRTRCTCHSTSTSSIPATRLAPAPRSQEG
ncbi:MAG TPA: arginase family protein [Actinomycetota bacterium]|nr:arginase family protein [Actinomycetota bacterium]